MRYSDEADKLFPYLLPKIQRALAGGVSGGSGTVGIGGAPSPHGLNSAHHTGTISNAQAPQFLLADGTRALTGNLAVDAGIVIDGVDLSAHAADPDAHHARVTVGNGLSLSGQLVAVDLATNPGLEFVSGKMRVDLVTNSGMQLDANGLGLGAPSTLSVSSANSITTSTHNHAITSSSDVGTSPVASILASNATGWLTLAQLTLRGNLVFAGGNREIQASNDLTVTPGNDLILDPTGLIVLPNAQEMRTGTFSDLVTGITGFRMWDRGSNYRQLTTGAIKADEMYVRVFVADEVRIDRGEEYWSKSYGVVETDFTLPADEATVDVWFENSPGLAAANIFSVNDWLLARTIDWDTSLTIEKIWFQVVSLLTAGSVDGYRQQWRIRRKSGGTTSSIVKKGNVLLDSGQVGQGWIHLSALEQDGGPFIQIGEYTSVSSDVPQFTNYVRIGNLNGVVDYATDEWGQAAGNNLGITPSTGFSGYAVDATNGLRLFNTSFLLYDGSTLATSITNGDGIRLLQDTGLDSNPNRYIEWYSDLATPVDSELRATLRAYDDAAGSTVQLFAIGAAGDSSYLQIGTQVLGGGGSAFIGISRGGGSSNIEISSSYTTVSTLLGVGNGNIAPSSILHVYENTSTTGAAAGLTIEQDGTGDAVAHFSLTGGQTYSMGIDNSDSDAFKISGSSDLGTSGLLYLSASGYLGVGIAPSAKLEILSGGIRLNSNQGTNGGDVGGPIEFYNQAAPGVVAYIKAIRESQTYNAAIIFATRAGGSATERMRIDAGGNVGIGITPSTKLEIADGGIRLNSNQATNGGDVGGPIEFYNQATSGVVAYIKAIRQSETYNAALIFATRAGGSASEKVRIDAAGNVGIGVSSIGAKVDTTTSGTTPGLRVSQYASAAPTMAGWRAQGTEGSPSQVGDGNVLALMSGRGYTSGGWATDYSGEIQIVAAETFNGGTTGKRGGRVEIYTTAVGGTSLTKRLTVGDGGQITFSAAAYSAYTSASAANMYMDTNGLIWRSTSSGRYKTDVRDLPVALGDNLIDKLHPVLYKSKNVNDGTRDYVGLIAEEVLAAGGDGYVELDEEGVPQGVMYDRLIVAVIAALKGMRKELDYLKGVA